MVFFSLNLCGLFFRAIDPSCPSRSKVSLPIPKEKRVVCYLTYLIYLGIDTSSGESTLSDAKWMKDELKKFNEERDTNKDGRMDADEIKAWVIPDFNGSIVEEVKHLMKEADHDKVCLSGNHFSLSLSPCLLITRCSIKYTCDACTYIRSLI